MNWIWGYRSKLDYEKERMIVGSVSDQQQLACGWWMEDEWDEPIFDMLTRSPRLKQESRCVGAERHDNDVESCPRPT